MNKLLMTGMSFGLAMAISASAFTITGKVSDEGGKAVQNASVALLTKGLRTETDATGAFTLHQDEPDEGGAIDALVPQNSAVGYLSVNGGVLSFSQGTSAPVQVQIFDMMGNRLLKQTLYGSGTVDMNASVKAEGVYFARVSVGSAQQTFKFTADGSFNAAFGEKTTTLVCIVLMEYLNMNTFFNMPQADMKRMPK